jgi:hypothetical protein
MQISPKAFGENSLISSDEARNRYCFTAKARRIEAKGAEVKRY